MIIPREFCAGADEDSWAKISPVGLTKESCFAIGAADMTALGRIGPRPSLFSKTVMMLAPGVPLDVVSLIRR